jgi:hypothetical protein
VAKIYQASESAGKIRELNEKVKTKQIDADELEKGSFSLKPGT